MFRVDQEGNPVNKDLLILASQMKKGRGLLMFVGTIEGEPVNDFHCVDRARENLAAMVASNGIEAFTRVILVQNAYSAFITAFQTIGVGALRPNTIIMSWGYYWKEDQAASVAFVDSLKAAISANRALIVFKQSERGKTDPAYALSNDILKRGTIDIWWLVHDGGLLLLIPHQPEPPP